MAKLSVIGLVLLVLGIGLFTASFVPVPVVSYNPKTKTVYEPKYTIVSKVWLEETFTVSPGRAAAYCGSFPSGTTLTITIKVVSGGNRDINFWAMDEDEWDHFKLGESYHYYTVPSRNRVVDTSIVWTPPANQRICFVYDNTFSIITSKTVYTKITAEYPTYTLVPTNTTTYEPEMTPRSLGFLAIPGILLIIVGVSLIVGSRIGKLWENT